MRLRNPLNGSHRHWSVGAKERREHRARASWTVRSMLIPTRGQSYSISLIRITPAAKGFDFDGLVASFKAVRDGVADALGYTDDSDPRLTWSYAHRKGEPKEHAVEIVVEVPVRDGLAELEAQLDRKVKRKRKVAGPIVPLECYKRMDFE